MENTYSPLKSALESQGKAFTQENLNNLATSQGLSNYKGTDAQNVELLNKINAGVKPIALDNLNVPQVNIPSPAPVTPVAAQTNLASTILEQTKVQDTEAQQKASNLSQMIANLTPQLQGQTQALAEAQQQSGVQALTQNLTDINNQILMKTAEINQDDIKLQQSLQTIEDKPVAMEFISGEQQSVQRNAQLARALKNAEIGILNARAIGLQGNIQLAMDTAKQAVELKYAPQREAIATYKAQLEALQPILSADEKKQAREQELRTNLALKEVDNKQKQETAIQEMLINASSQGAPASLVARAQKAKTPGEVAMILGQYAGDYFKTELLKQQIATEKAQRSKIYSDVAKTNAELAALTNTSGTRQLSGEELAKFNSVPQIKDAQAAVPFRQALADYKNAIETYGTGEVFGRGSGALNEAYQRLSGAIKDYYKLGSLDNGVQKLISIGIPEPSITGLKSGRISALDSAISAIDKDVANKFKQLETTVYKNTVEYNEIKNQYLQEAAKSKPVNKFQQSIGQNQSSIPGTSIINNVNADGSLDFILPTTK